jgi:hypothetical protein
LRVRVRRCRVRLGLSYEEASYADDGYLLGALLQVRMVKLGLGLGLELMKEASYADGWVLRHYYR